MRSRLVTASLQCHAGNRQLGRAVDDPAIPAVAAQRLPEGSPGDETPEFSGGRNSSLATVAETLGARPIRLRENGRFGAGCLPLRQRARVSMRPRHFWIASGNRHLVGADREGIPLAQSRHRRRAVGARLLLEKAAGTEECWSWPRTDRAVSADKRGRSYAVTRASGAANRTAPQPVHQRRPTPKGLTSKATDHQRGQSCIPTGTRTDNDASRLREYRNLRGER